MKRNQFITEYAQWLEQGTGALFVGAGLCIRSYAKGVLGAKTPKAGAGYPDDWVGHHPHTHRAIDDARGYAHLLAHLMQVARAKSDTHGGS